MDEEFKPNDRVRHAPVPLYATVIEVMDSGTLRLKWDTGFETLSDPNHFEKVAPRDSS